MFRVKKLCRYLNEYRPLHYKKFYEGSGSNLNPKSIYQAVPQTDLVNYIAEKEGAEGTIEAREPIFHEVKDCISDGFFVEGEFGYGLDGSGGNRHTVALGTKGRKLLRGNFIKRWAYFLQYAFEEHDHIYTILFSASILALFFDALLGVARAITTGIISLWLMIEKVL